MAQTFRFLVVDDFATMRRAIKTVLKELGYLNITEAEDGNTALRLLQAGDFDLLITDWRMPGGMSGLELLSKVRAHERLSKLPVLMLTAEAERGRIVAAMQAGVTAYIIKPFSSAALREKIERMLSGKG